jgi:hypothetical protein
MAASFVKKGSRLKASAITSWGFSFLQMFYYPTIYPTFFILAGKKN